MAVRAPADPFGARPTVRRRGWVRIVLGAALLACGLVVSGVGIVGAVRASARLHDDAVGRSVVRAGSADAVTFVNGAAARRSYTVYLDFDGVTSNAEVHDLASRDTACVATLPDGAETRFRGARQGVALTLGSAVSVGQFSAQPGRVSLRCAYSSGTRASRVRRPDAVPYLVTPGRPNGLTSVVGLILGGVAGGLLGAWLLLSGWRGRRVPRARA